MSLIESVKVTVCGLFLIVCGCNSAGIHDKNKMAPQTIFQHYSIIYHEGSEKLHVYAQFRSLGDKGTPIALVAPGNIQFDDSILNVNTSDTAGVFFNQTLSVESIFGNHHFVFTNMDKKRYVNEFSFDDFRLVNLPMTVVKGEQLNIEFETSPLRASDYVQIQPVGTDSSFSVTYSGADTVKHIVIPAGELQRQKNGQMKLAATLYRRIPLKQATQAGGVIEIMYALNPVYINVLP